MRSLRTKLAAVDSAIDTVVLDTNLPNKAQGLESYKDLLFLSSVLSDLCVYALLWLLLVLVLKKPPRLIKPWVGKKLLGGGSLGMWRDSPSLF